MTNLITFSNRIYIEALTTVFKSVRVKRWKCWTKIKKGFIVTRNHFVKATGAERWGNNEHFLNQGGGSICRYMLQLIAIENQQCSLLLSLADIDNWLSQRKIPWPFKSLLLAIYFDFLICCHPANVYCSGRDIERVLLCRLSCPFGAYPTIGEREGKKKRIGAHQRLFTFRRKRYWKGKTVREWGEIGRACVHISRLVLYPRRL